MSKSTISRAFVGASVAVATGVVLGLAAVLLAITRGAVSVGGPTVVTVDGEALGASLIWLAIASLVVAAGLVAAAVAWVGAVLNTARLRDKTWFILLLVLGLCGVGWLAMAAYVLAGPDGTNAGVSSRSAATTAQT